MSRLQTDSPTRESFKSSGLGSNESPFNLLLPPYFVLEEEEQPDPYDSDGQPVDPEKYLPTGIKTRNREKKGDYGELQIYLLRCSNVRC